MPWDIRKEGNEWCVYKEGTNEKVGCSPTEERAKAHLRALYASEKGDDGGSNGRVVGTDSTGTADQSVHASTPMKPSFIGQIFEDPAAFVSKAFGFQMDTSAADNDDPPSQTLTLMKVKGEDGSEQLRFMALWSNNFEDRGGDAIPALAHEDLVEYCDKEGIYPVLVNWHAIGTEYGQVDCMVVNEGYNVAFGYILPGKEDIAYRVAEYGDIGMSHGALYQTDPLTGQIIRLRSFEISTLPSDRAKNSWTSWFLGQWEKEMGFSPDKIDYLKKVGHTDEQIAQAQQMTEQFAAQLKEIGIAFKDDEPPTSESLLNVVGQLTGVVQQLTSKIENLEQQTAVIPDLTTKVEAANASIDERIAQMVSGQTRQMGTATVHAASKSDDNVSGGSGQVNVQARPTVGNGWAPGEFRQTWLKGVHKPSDS